MDDLTDEIVIEPMLTNDLIEEDRRVLKLI